MTGECGIFPRGTALDYHKEGPGRVLTSSLAKILVSDTPWHAWTNSRLNPNYHEEEKEAFDLGTVAHALMLEGLSIATVLDFPDWKTKAAREARDSCRACGQIPILTKHWARVQAMVAAGKAQIAAHREASDVFTDAGKPELTLAWVDDHDVPCRARLDWLRNDLLRIADYKSVGNTANPETISRTLISAGWDVQASFYLRGLKKITDKNSQFLFVAQETEPPYALSVIGIGPDILWLGEKKVQAAIDLWAKCLDSGHWPGYADRICYPILPAWEENRWVEKELR